MIVVGDDLNLSPVDAALGVDLVGGDLSRLRNRGARDRLRLRDHADLDGRLIFGRGRLAPASAERPSRPGRRGSEKTRRNVDWAI